MKTQGRNPHGKSGGALVMAMVVLLSFSTLILGLYKLRDTLSVETVYLDHSKQAFWESEIGLKDAIQRLRFDSSFRTMASGGSASFFVTNVLDRKSYVVSVKRDYMQGNPMVDHYVFDVTSVGYKGGMNRVIEQTVETRPGFLSAIMAPNNIIINQNTLVDGPIMVLDDGQLIIDDKIPPGQASVGDFDIIILDDDAVINEKKSGASEGDHYDVVDLPVPDDIPDMPDFSGYYDDAMLETTNLALGVDLGDINLTELDADDDGVVYYNVPNGITVNSISGEGILVNTGSINLTPKSTVEDVDVTSDVQIISFGSVDIGQKNDFAGDTLVYAAGSLYFGDASSASASSVLLADGVHSGNSIFDAGDAIVMGGHSQFQGIVFADDGNVIIQQGSNGDETRIEGTVISGDSVDLGQNSEILFNPDFFNTDYFDLESFFELSVIAYKKTWEELPPN